MKQSGGASQVWDMDKFENKVIDMRDFYQEWKEKVLSFSSSIQSDPAALSLSSPHSSLVFRQGLPTRPKGDVSWKRCYIAF